MNKKLRIAHVAPLYASVPPSKYGGTERILDWLINEQVGAGHDVTLFASGDSLTAAKLIPVIPRALWHDDEISIADGYHTIELDMVAKRASEFDIIHCHFDSIHYQILHHVKTPVVTTLHWRVDLREFQDLYHYFNEASLVAISNSQKSFIPQANVVNVIYHGLPIDNYPFVEKPGKYIAFVGRFSPEKGAEIAIDTAFNLEMPIKLAARMPQNGRDKNYFETELKPRMDSPLVEYIGEVGDQRKADLLGNALVTLVPTNWPEPFGLVTIESLCCGTPVVVRPIGCTKEIVKDGEVGYIANSVQEMTEAVKKIERIDRKKCRAYVEENFSSPIMAKQYEQLYRKLIGG